MMMICQMVLPVLTEGMRVGVGCTVLVFYPHVGTERSHFDPIASLRDPMPFSVWTQFTV
jgi:hypothetical protein